MTDPQNTGATFSSDPLAVKVEGIISITWDNLKFIKPEWLEDEHILYQLKLFALDVGDSGDPADASQLFTILRDLLTKIPDLAQRRPDIFREYLRILTILRASFLTIVPENDVGRFLKESLILTLEVEDFDLKDKINELFSLYLKFPDAQANIAKELLRPVEDNQEFLGTEPLVLKGQEFEQLPKVSNWLKDYNQFVTSLSKPGFETRGGGAERAMYIGQGSNVRHLTEDQRAILLRLLELYDWLRSFVPSIAKQVIPGVPIYVQKERMASPVTKRPTLQVKPSPRTLPTPPRPPLRQGFREQAQVRTLPAAEPKSVRTQEPQRSEIRQTPSRPEPQIQQAAASLNEELYRFTLEELAKMRTYEEEHKTPPAKPVSITPPVHPPKFSPENLGGQAKPPATSPTYPRSVLGPPDFSVNEAIIHGSVEPPKEEYGEIVPGNGKPPETDLEKKLKELEKKLNKKPEDEEEISL